MVFLAIKIKDLRSLIYDEFLAGGTDGKTVNIISNFIFFIVLEVFPIYFSLENNLATTFIKEVQSQSKDLLIQNDLNDELIRNSIDSSSVESKNEQKLEKGNIIINTKQIKKDIKDYLAKEEDIIVQDKLFERKNGLGIIHKGKYKKENAIIRIIQFDRISRYNIEDIIRDFEQFIYLNNSNISNMLGYFISQDNKVYLISKEFQNGSLYDYVHIKEKTLSKEEKMNIYIKII